MKHYLRKIAVVLIALLLVGIMVLCIACDPTQTPDGDDDTNIFEGDYTEVIDQESIETILRKFQEKYSPIVNQDLEKFAYTYEVSITEQDNTISMRNSYIVDGNMWYVKSKFTNMTDPAGEIEFPDESELWFNFEVESITEFIVYYRITTNGQTRQGKLSIEDQISESDMAYFAFTEFVLDEDILVSFDSVGIFLEDGLDSITSSGAFTISMNNDKLKFESTVDGVRTLYVLLSEDDSFNVRYEESTTTDTVTEHYLYELKSSSATVTFPNFK